MKPGLMAFAVAAAMASGTPAAAQSVVRTETISVGDPLPGWSKIRPGSRHYLRYRVKGDRRIALDIWSRTTSFEPDPKGVERLHIVQRWTGASLPFDREVDSWFEAKTFRPLSHASKRVAAGKTTTAAVIFASDRVIGDGKVGENSQAGLNVAMPVPTFNFEADMELLGALPWRQNYAARINFYHPGGDAPAWYEYRVVGSQPVTIGGRALDSWVVAIDYGKLGSAKFWIDKQSHVVLKAATIGPDIDGILYKILLPDEPN